jgi:hypothetical protein
MLRFVANLSELFQLPRTSIRKSTRDQGLKYQNLEARHLLASITYNAGTETVTMVGDATEDIGQVFEIGTDVTFKLTGVSDFTLDTTGNALTQIRFFGGDGNDTFTNNTAVASVASGGDGDDILNGGGGADTFFGGDGNDTLRGGAEGDSLFGNDGNDILFGNTGNDLILGAVGNDTAYGGEGNDTIWGSDGNDTIYGGDGSDILNGQNNDDLIFGGIGNDEITGAAGDDILYGQQDNDDMYGNQGVDKLNAGIGDDNLHGGDGDDDLFGGDGNDNLYGEAGADTLVGQNGDDGLFGGINVNTEDILFGNDGKDRFLFSSYDYVADALGEDAEVAIRNGNVTWTNLEVEILDDHFQTLIDRTQNTALLKGTMTDEPLVFIKDFAIASATEVGTNALVSVTNQVYDPATGQIVPVTVLERQITIGEWDEFDKPASDELLQGLPQVMAYTWAGPEAVPSVLPNDSSWWAQWRLLSGWTDTFPNQIQFYEVSGDNNWWYLKSAEFAADDSTFNPDRDWATSWNLYFNDDPAVDADKARLLNKMNKVDELFTKLEIF